MLTLRSPAKVNLFLRVTARRADGYHELASLFQTINLFDTLSIKFAEHDILSCSDSKIPTDSSNLVWKAVEAFRKRTGFSQKLEINLVKRIPIQAGLGGGSGNAATTLWALNELVGRPLSTTELLSLSADVGSDVPFFFSQGTAFCTGRGEFVKEVSLPQNISFYLVKPAYGLSTPQVFKALDIGALPQRNPEVSLQKFLEGDFDLYNDLELPAYAIAPELGHLRDDLLRSGFSSVIMTGSGSSLCCYGPGRVPQDPSLFTHQVTTTTRAPNAWY
jgi:4-diphosphocytidyl-2-C-methyl-D-erythritol kinase